MVAAQSPLEELVMAERTLLLARVHLLPGGDRVDGGRAIVSDLAESLGNEEIASGDERDGGEDEYHRKTRYLLGYLVLRKLRQVDHWRVSSGARGSRAFWVARRMPDWG
jgi:hypothetical protein